MSLTFKTKVITLAAVGLGIGFSASYLRAHQSRKPASLADHGLKPLKIGKHLAVLTAEITAASEIPEKDDQEIELIGLITVQQNLEGELEYQWTLPEGVHVVEGQINDVLVGVTAGQTAKVRLYVTGFSKKSQKLISLQASAAKGSLQFGNSAVIASRSEDTWEAIAPQMKEEAAKQLQQKSTTSE